MSRQDLDSSALVCPLTVGMKKLAFFVGHPGCGKSTLGEALARLLQWPLIDKDDSRDCFQATEELQGLPASVLNALAYRVMFRTHRQAAASGQFCYC